MNINKLAKKIHSANKKKGFWDKKRNEGEMLMLVISELSEMIEADRKIITKSANPIQLFEIDLARLESRGLRDVDKKIARMELFEKHVKDTMGDELADAFIRFCDYCVGFEKRIDQTRINSIYKKMSSVVRFRNLGGHLLVISGKIAMAECRLDGVENEIFSHMIWLAEELNIPLERHIGYKMWYNSNRPKMHGKKY